MITKNEHLERRIKKLGGLDMFAKVHPLPRFDTIDEFIESADRVAGLFKSALASGLFKKRTRR